MGLPRTVVPACFLVLVVSFNAADARPLKSELSILMSDHPRLKAKAQAQETAAAQKDEADARFLPRVDLLAGIGREYAKKPVSRQPAGAEWLTRDDEELRITYNLFEGYGGQARQEAARLRGELANVDLENARQALLFDGVSIYLRVWHTDKLRQLALANEETVRKQLALENARVERGSGVAVDVLLSKARLQVAEEARVAIEGLGASAAAKYQGLFGSAPEVGSMAQAVPPAALTPTNKEAALTAARASHPVLQAREVEIAIAEQGEKAASSDFYPKIDLLGSALREDNIDGSKGSEYTYSAQIRLRWNLYAGGGTEAQRHAALSRISERRARLSSSVRDVDEEVKVSWEEFASTRARMQLLGNAASIAQEVVDAREKMRAAGRETAINVLNAKSELFQTRIKFEGASFAHNVAGFRLVRAVGALTANNMGVPPGS